jgi:hypothetical protein
MDNSDWEYTSKDRTLYAGHFPQVSNPKGPLRHGGLTV